MISATMLPGLKASVMDKTRRILDERLKPARPMQSVSRAARSGQIAPQDLSCMSGVRGEMAAGGTPEQDRLRGDNVGMRRFGGDLDRSALRTADQREAQNAEHQDHERVHLGGSLNVISGSPRQTSAFGYVGA